MSGSWNAVYTEAAQLLHRCGRDRQRNPRGRAGAYFQPSVSAAISHLEQVLGVQLFVRQHAQGLALTPAGARLLKAAKESLRAAHDLYDVASEAVGTVSGPIDVGAFRTFAPLIIPEVWMTFQTLNPQVQIRVTVGDEAQLLNRLRASRIDIALTYEIHIGDDMQFQPLAELPTYVLLGADHPLAGRPSLTLSELADEPFVLLDLPLSRQYFLSLSLSSRRKSIRGLLPSPTMPQCSAHSSRQGSDIP